MAKKTFDEVVLFARTGLNPRNNFKLGNGDNKYITIKNIHDGELVIDDNTDVVSDEAINLIHKRSQIKKGDILFCSIGRIGDMYIIENEPEGWDINESVFAFTLNSDIIYQKYFYYIFKNQNTIRLISKNSSGSTFKSIKMNQIKKMVFELPPLEEQKKVINILDNLSLIIKNFEKELKKLDELTKARFVEMFGALTDTVPLSHYIKALTAGKSLPGEEECRNKVLKTGAATYDYFDETQVKNLPVDYTPLAEHQIHDGDVIISRMNTAELVGATAYIWKAPDNTYLPDRLWRAELKEKVNPIFVWQVIIQSSTKEAIRRIAGGTSGSMKNISKPGLLGVNVIKVSLDQQNQFAAFVSQTDKS